MTILAHPKHAKSLILCGFARFFAPKILAGYFSLFGVNSHENPKRA
jgi:hypothetical protein